MKHSQVSTMQRKVYLEQDLNSEYSCKEVVEVFEDIVSWWVGSERILGCEEDGAHHDTHQDEVTKESVVHHIKTKYAESEKQKLEWCMFLFCACAGQGILIFYHF